MSLSAPVDDRRGAWLRLVSGEVEGPLAALGRAALVPLAGLYRVGLAGREVALFLRGRPCRAPCPVVSVGNLTVGGTGKTPMTAWLVGAARDLGVRPLVVSRGYAARPGKPNDEALELAHVAADVPHAQHPDRVAAIKQAGREGPVDLVILDDGFQHRRIHRDLDLVLVDALCPFGFGHLLPRGLLREPLSALARATHVVLTRADRVEASSLEAIRRCVRKHADRGRSAPLPVLAAAHRPSRLLVDEEPPKGPESLRGTPVAAACGIGNPRAFRLALEDLGATIVQWTAFPDHHAYTAADLADLATRAKAAGAERLVTTVKDHVKWRALGDGAGAGPDVPLAALEVRLELLEGEDGLRRDLKRLLGR